MLNVQVQSNDLDAARRRRRMIGSHTRIQFHLPSRAVRFSSYKSTKDRAPRVKCQGVLDSGEGRETGHAPVSMLQGSSAVQVATLAVEMWSWPTTLEAFRTSTQQSPNPARSIGLVRVHLEDRGRPGCDIAIWTEGSLSREAARRDYSLAQHARPLSYTVLTL